MKILGIMGSPRDNKTSYMLNKLLQNHVNNSEIIKLSDLNIKPCLSCRQCIKEPFECAQGDDIEALKRKLEEADIIVFASPTYFDNVTGSMKNFFDRCLGLYWSEKLAGKKAILLSVCGGKRKNSVERCLDSMTYFCELMKMVILGRVGAIDNERSKDKELELLSKAIN